MAIERDVETQETELVVERQFEPGDVVAALRVGHEGVGAVGDPFDRPAELLRGPQHEHVLGIEEQFHAEAAADISGHDADAVLGDLEDVVGEQVADKMRALRRAPQRVGILARIVFADGAARLHRIDDDPVVDELEADAMARRRHCPLDRGAVADLPVEAEIARRLVPYLRLARIEGVRGVDDGGQRLVIDRDQLGRVARRGGALRHDHRDRVADMPHPVAGDRRMRRQHRRRSVAIGDRAEAGDRPDAVARQVIAGKVRQARREQQAPPRRRSRRCGRAHAASAA